MSELATFLGLALALVLARRQIRTFYRYILNGFKHGFSKVKLNKNDTALIHSEHVTEGSGFKSKVTWANMIKHLEEND